MKHAKSLFYCTTEEFTVTVRSKTTPFGLASTTMPTFLISKENSFPKYSVSVEQCVYKGDESLS